VGTPDLSSELLSSWRSSLIWTAATRRRSKSADMSAHSKTGCHADNESEESLLPAVRAALVSVVTPSSQKSRSSRGAEDE